MERLAFFVGVIGNVTSILMFLSPGRTFLRIVRNKSTEEFESLPYITTLLSSCFWTYYGAIRPGSFLVVTVNGVGTVLEIIYITLFLVFSPPWKRNQIATLFGLLNVLFFALSVFVTYELLDVDSRIHAVGLIASGLSIIMYASPLWALRILLMNKSVEYMPFLVSFFLFLSGGVWTFYAVIMKDWFLGVPNAIGFVLGAVQMGLYAMYRKASSSTVGPLLQVADETDPLVADPKVVDWNCC